MDIDRFIAQNQMTWSRLQHLTGRARSNPGNLTEPELDEMIQLYQRVSTQLSHARTYFHDGALTAQLTATVAAASSVIYGSRPRTFRPIVLFFSATFPTAVWQARRYIGLASALLFLPALAMMLWLTHSPEALDASASKADREFYADEAFESYYSDQPSALFATEVGTNNVFVSFLAFAGGAAAMVPGVYILVMNGVALGQAGAWMTTEGEATLFWTLIAPHGLLELTSIVVAAGAGLLLGWTLLVPGDRTRADAMAEEGKRAGAIIVGLVACFGVAALIEGFVTGSGLPIEIKVATGVLVWVAFVLYITVLGREGERRGVEGQLGEFDRGVAVS